MSDKTRTATVCRATGETDVRVSINLDGAGTCSIATGLPFLDHMLTALSLHSGIDIDLSCTGDLEVDDHHTVEDCALALGKAVDDALGDRVGITRFGAGFAPLDEALARCVIDLSGRPFAFVGLDLTREMLGSVACENLTHFFQSFATASRLTLHLDMLRGENDHHKAEAAFKACALALRQAITLARSTTTVPSTKGVLTS